MQNQTPTLYNRSEDATAVEPDLEYEYVDRNGSSHVYEPLSLATKDKGNVYMRMFPASKVKQQTISSEVSPALPTDASDLTMEHFAEADPRQAQLWMLLQIQKMVQKMEKMEDMYESAGYLRPPSPLLPTTTGTQQPPPSADYLRPPSPLPPMEQPPPMTESDLEYQDASSTKQSTAAETQQPPPLVTESNQIQQNLPTRKGIYVNVTQSGGIQTKSADKPRPVPRARSSRPPAIPPRTYKKISYVQVKDSCPPDTKSRLQHTSAERNVKQESQIVPGAYKNVPQQEVIGKVIFIKCLLFISLLLNYLQTP